MNSNRGQYNDSPLYNMKTNKRAERKRPAPQVQPQDQGWAQAQPQQPGVAQGMKRHVFLSVVLSFVLPVLFLVALIIPVNELRWAFLAVTALTVLSMWILGAFVRSARNTLTVVYVALAVVIGLALFINQQSPEALRAIRKEFEARISPFYFDNQVEAPVEENQTIGTVEFAGKDGEAYEGTIVALRSVAREPDTADEAFYKWVDNSLPQWVRYLMPRYYPIAWVLYIVLIVALVALIVYVSSRRARKNRARRAALEARRREYLRRMQREEYLRKHPEARQRAKTSDGAGGVRRPVKGGSASNTGKRKQS